MLVVIWVVEGTWRSCISAARQLVPPDAEIVLLHVTGPDSHAVAHGAFVGMLGRGHPERDPSALIDTDAAASAHELLEAAAAGLPGSATQVQRRGRVEREVVAAAEGAELLVLARDGEKKPNSVRRAWVRPAGSSSTMRPALSFSSGPSTRPAWRPSRRLRGLLLTGRRTTPEQGLRYPRGSMLSTLVLACLVGAAMIICGWRAWLGERWSAAVLVLLGLVWLRIDKRFEGPHLLVLGHEHGLVLANLVAFGAFAVAALGMWRYRSLRQRRHERVS